MPAVRGQTVAVLGLALVVFFSNLGGAGLFDEDEPKNAACGAEMLARGDWLVPSFNHELRTDKPILLYWLMLLAYHALGVSEFSARLASATLAVGCVLLVEQLGRRLYGGAAGFFAALVLATSLMFDVVGRAATPDATLIFCTTLALSFFVAGGRGWKVDGSVPTLAASNWRDWIPGHPGWTIAWGAAMGLAVLAKGPVGLVLPTVALGTFALVQWPVGSIAPVPGGATWWTRARNNLRWLASCFAPRRVVQVAWHLRPLLVLGVVAVVALPWYAAVGIETEGQWLRGFLGQHNVGRFLTPMEGHRGPIVYHLLSIATGFFPWSVLLPLAVATAVDRLHTGHARGAADRLTLCWVATYVLFFSLARTKLPNYVLPAYPCLALLMGAMLASWWSTGKVIRPRLLRFLLGIYPIVGLGLMVGLAVTAHLLLPGDELLGLCGLVPLVCGGLAWKWACDRPRWSVAAVSGLAVGFSLLALAVVAPRAARHQTSRQVVAEARARSGAAARLATFEFFEPSLVFYSGARVERPAGGEQIRQFFLDSPHAYLVTRADRLKLVQGYLPEGVGPVWRHRRFLRTHELVVLGYPNRSLAQQPELPTRR